jgi:hypothetical protein
VPVNYPAHVAGLVLAQEKGLGKLETGIIYLTQS